MAMVLEETGSAVMCPECDRAFLEKDGDEWYCPHCRDHIKLDGQARGLVCPDAECRGELRFDSLVQGYPCLKCGTIWGRSSVEKGRAPAKNGKIISC